MCGPLCATESDMRTFSIKLNLVRGHCNSSFAISAVQIWLHKCILRVLGVLFTVFEGVVLITYYMYISEFLCIFM